VQFENAIVNKDKGAESENNRPHPPRNSVSLFARTYKSEKNKKSAHAEREPGRVQNRE
jgi:hypothetical protein